MMPFDTLSRHVKGILLKDWDPIGIAGEPRAHDEYDSYVAPVADMLRAGKPANDILSYLLNVETAAMGLKGDPLRARRVVEKLQRL